MTAVDMTPYWPAIEDWTGFLLVIVPGGPLPVSGERLRRLVREQIETDAVLYDLVTVTLAAPFEPTTAWDRSFLTNVVEAIMPDRHFFAPRGVLGIVVVASQKRALDDALADLKTSTALSRLGARLFGVGVQPDERAGVSPNSVLRIADVATVLIEMYEEMPRIALAEQTFLGRISDLIKDHGLVLPDLEPEPPAAPLTEQPIHVVELEPDGPAVEASATQPPPGRPELSQPPVPEPPATEARRPEPIPVAPAAVSAPITVQGPMPSPEISDAHAPAPSGRHSAAPPAAPPPRRRVKAVMYDGAEIVAVDQRTPMQRLTRQNPTDVDALDALLRDGRAVGLVYLVFVPDDGVVSRRVAKRRNTIALELDQTFSSVDLDAITGVPAHVAVEVFSATNPVQKHGVLRGASDMTESALPKVEIEYFSVSEIVDPLLDGARRTSRALQARGVEVVSLHLVFLAAMRFPADESTADDWIRLLERARVTWIDFSPPDRRQSLYPMPPSPFGLHVLTDKEDVVAVIKQQSEVLYQYTSQPDATPDTTRATDDQSADVPPAKARRRWPLGKRPTE
jgi:hypothetical protein